MKNRLPLSKKIKEALIHGGFLVNAVLVILVLLGIFVLLIWTSLPAFEQISLKEFLFSSNWNPTSYVRESYGMLSMLVSSLLVTLGAMIFAVPISIGAAAFISDLASNRVREIAKPVVEILASIPSVVIGFIGITLIGPAIAKVFDLPDGLNAVNGSILIGIMAMPTIISLTEDALKSVPKSYTEASLALGATKWQTIIRVRIPAASSGIIAAAMLGMGRAIGETMTVLMATGCAGAMPNSLFDSVKTMTSVIAIELGEVAYGTAHYYALFVVGLALFLITFAVNLAAEIIFNKKQKR
ncbi:MAG TPA: phosphate ABC transporter permease subunit PstC [bacterium]|nr:phosphate ABC transporter permease subunit PstC [bacterium]